MATINEYWQRARTLPPQQLVLKSLQLAKRKMLAQSELIKAHLKATYQQVVTQDQEIGPHLFRQILNGPPDQLLLARRNIFDRAIQNHLGHRFDLLGSGWVEVSFGTRCQGCEGHLYSEEKDLGQLRYRPNIEGLNEANRTIARQIWCEIKGNYQPIDWQRDFKSGYRWAEGQHYSKILYGHKPGVDIKVPWELARMQHLVLFCYGIRLAMIDNDLARVKVLQDEIRHQILDFIAMNPPQFGVNWKCPMDIAIRAANWLLAVDLCHSQEVYFDRAFYRILINSLFDHGHHIRNHLEWSSSLRGNHYLADISGLAWIGASLKDFEWAKDWLDFAHRELEAESEYQFFSDGANFEGSTAYHRLSTEMLLYSTAAVIKAKNRSSGPCDALKVFSKRHYETLARAMGFSAVCHKPNHEITQFGDNDSGRFFKIEPIYDEELSENHLDHRPLITAGLGFFTGSNDKDPSIDQTNERGAIGQIEGSILSQFSRAIDLPASLLPFWRGAWPVQTRMLLPPAREKQDSSISFDHKEVYQIRLPGFSNKDLRCFSFTESGYFFVKSDSFHLAIRCGPIGQKTFGGHDHNDQLTIDLWHSGRQIIADPGTYLYTPAPKLRNLYRSRRAHFAPDTGIEPAPLNQGLFSLKGGNPGRMLEFHSERVLMTLNINGGLLSREILFLNEMIQIVDRSQKLPVKRLLSEGVAIGDRMLWPSAEMPVSKGYGLK